MCLLSSVRTHPEDLCSNTEELDVAHGEHCPGLQGVGVLTPPQNSPGNQASHLTSLHLGVLIGKVEIITTIVQHLLSEHCFK